jgi:hypothetical protein
MAFVDVPVGIALVLLVIANSIGRRVDGRFGAFVAEASSLWAGFTIAWSVTHGRVTDDLVTWLLGSIGLAAVWGWIFVRRKTPGAPGSGASGAAAIYALAVEPVVRWLTGLRMSAKASDPVTRAAS